MRKSRFSESQILKILKEVEGGRKVADVCREYGVSQATYYTWKSKVGDAIPVKESKTGKLNYLVVNKEIKKVFGEYYEALQPEEDFYLFRSRKGENAPLTTYRATRLVKGWGEAVGIKHNLGAHTLRKTFCWFQRMKYGTTWEVLCKRLNHSSPSITRAYMGVTEECVTEILHHSI